MSLYADYKKELEGKDTIENDKGFLVYEVAGDVCWIAEIYVAPAYRRTNVGTLLAQEAEHSAKKRGCKKLLGSVVPNRDGSTERLKAILSYGFKLQSSQDNFIWFEKDII